MKIDTLKKAAFSDKFNGYKFFIGNKTDSIIRFEASDSRLSVIAEVYYQDKWQPIEYLPTSWCGNSFHNVYLKKNHYWEFIVPKFSEKIRTKLRFKLEINETKYIYSNVILSNINKRQLEVKQGHIPSGLGDSYYD